MSRAVFIFLSLFLIFFLTGINAVSAESYEGFVDSGQMLGTYRSWDVALGDVDGDGDTDAVVANRNAETPSKVWLNDGKGNFTDSGISLGTEGSWCVGLGDIDGQNGSDIIIDMGESSKVFLNNGNGQFSEKIQDPTLPGIYDIHLGDVDGDNDLDAFVRLKPPYPVKIWLNDGNGSFSASDTELGGFDFIGLADINGDNDLDLWLGKFGLFIKDNDGSGNFTTSAKWGLDTGTNTSTQIAIGDLDADGDADVVTINLNLNDDFTYHGYTRILKNTEALYFDESQELPIPPQVAIDATDVKLGDVDKDGDLDIFMVFDTYSPMVFLNDGSGVFSDSGQTTDVPSDEIWRLNSVALGKLNSDNWLDAFIARGNFSGSPNIVYFYDAPPPEQDIFPWEIFYPAFIKNRLNENGS